MGEVEARPHLERGEQCLQREEWHEAELAFRAATDVHPESAVAYSKLGVALARQGRFGEGEAALRRAIQLSPRYAPGHSNLGNIYREQGRTQEALASYERAVEADPEYWIAHQNLGALYRELGRVGDAVRELKRATRLSMRTGQPGRRGCLGTGILALVLAVALVAPAVHVAAALAVRLIALGR